MPRAYRKHGLTKHPLYPMWNTMMQRCYNPNNKSYKNYGGRGVKVCLEWHDAKTFIADIERLLGPRPPGMSFDRKNNDGDYEPGNMRWATPSQQALNRRRRQRCSSQYKGVSWNKEKRKWSAGITIAGEWWRLGYRATEEDADLVCKTFHILHDIYRTAALLNPRASRPLN